MQIGRALARELSSATAQVQEEPARRRRWSGGQRSGDWRCRWRTSEQQQRIRVELAVRLCLLSPHGEHSQRELLHCPRALALHWRLWCSCSSRNAERRVHSALRLHFSLSLHPHRETGAANGHTGIRPDAARRSSAHE